MLQPAATLFIVPAAHLALDFTPAALHHPDPMNLAQARCRYDARDSMRSRRVTAAGTFAPAWLRLGQLQEAAADMFSVSLPRNNTICPLLGCSDFSVAVNRQDGLAIA